jgi:hypothetical protein
MRHPVSGAALLVLALVGCFAAPRLPTAPIPAPNVVVVCEDALLNGTLAGDPRDPHLAWVVSSDARVEVTWPTGFSAVFDPDLRMLGPDGTVVAKAGDEVSLGGSFGTADGSFGACAVNGRLFLPTSGSAAA